MKSFWNEPVRSLAGVRIALTGSTGGLGRELSRYLLERGASLLLLDRSAERAAAHEKKLREAFPTAEISRFPLDLSDMESVRAATEYLKAWGVEIFIHNAGAYSIPRHTCPTGYDNVFQINFASPYYMIRELLPTLRAVGGHVMVVGSIAHRYSASDGDDWDFHTRSRASLVYGNAKRYLMAALYALFENEKAVTLSVTHPGITFTNITAHYPPLVFAIIKYPMKLIFMKPRRAALSLLAGVLSPCGYLEWIGPRLFDVWGKPCRRRLRSLKRGEVTAIAARAEAVYRRCAAAGTEK